MLQGLALTELAAARFPIAEDLYKRSSGICAKADDPDCAARAVAGLAYSVSFVILKDPLLASLFLMLGGVLAVPVLVGLAIRLGQPIPVSALVAIVFALAAALGSAVHGGFDLANQLHPLATLPPDLPNPVDPA